MGKWAARLAEKTAAPVHDGTDKTDTRGVLSVLALTPEGSACDFQVGLLHAESAPLAGEPFGLAAVAWTDADIAAFRERRARLLRWGWTEAEAEALAERLVKRDRAHDERVSCTDCQHYRPTRCGNYRRAGLQSAEVGRDLAELLQRCEGFQLVRWLASQEVV